MQILLEKIVSQKVLEAKWLNTLSLLEHIGARKISKTVCQDHPSLAIMEHFHDEARHAYIFKKMSEALGGKNPGYLCADEAISYFQMLDHSVSELIEDHLECNDAFTNYTFVTCLIERRAMALYPLYQKITRETFVREELEGIINEETNHRVTIEAVVKKILSEGKIKSLESCLNLEVKLFETFCGSLEREVGGVSG